ncbi:hypothetical protein GGF46_004311 [Coemansia sp. RSA 552]|nr:hypothetical protein GGF46_004311 [Coemansia sp. RSA 552]
MLANCATASTAIAVLALAAASAGSSSGPIRFSGETSLNESELFSETAEGLSLHRPTATATTTHRSKHTSTHTTRHTSAAPQCGVALTILPLLGIIVAL